MAKSVCKLTKEIREEVAASVRYAANSRTTWSGKNRRSAAKAIARAHKLVEKTLPAWTPEQKKRIGGKLLGVMGTLYSGGEAVDTKTMAKTKAIIADLDRMSQRTCP